MVPLPVSSTIRCWTILGNEDVYIYLLLELDGFIIQIICI